MRLLSVFLTILILLATGQPLLADSPFLEEFKNNYGRLDTDLLNNPVEYGKISNFVYKKDVATFTFKEGEVFLLRYVMDRPTTAVFIGEGHATVDIPSAVERSNLEWCSGDSLVDTDFEVCFMRMADDLDLKLREAVEFEATTMEYKYYTRFKQAQGEYFFRPSIFHRYDNFFQLLRSCYERGEDGYFWSDFGRYNFVYDPNAPEEVTVGYEKEGGDRSFSEAAMMQADEHAVYDDEQMSQVPYHTTIISHEATFEMGGLDGKRMKSAETHTTIRINADSLRFLSLFLNYNLKDDSIYYQGAPVDYHRRGGGFNQIGIILPEYVYAGDSIELTLWYEGKDFTPAVPFVEDPSPAHHTLHFHVPKGFHYLMPDKGPSARANGLDTFTVVTSQPYWRFSFQPYVAGFEMVTTESDVGININVLKSDKFKKTDECLIPFDKYNEAAIQAFNDVSSRIGAPPGIFEINVYPESTLTMPGLVEIPQIYCYTSGLGGIDMEAGIQMARQWFGATMRFRSDREYWVADAVPDYIGIMHTQEAVGASAFFSELEDRKQQIQLSAERSGDMPLAVGDRAYPLLRTYKGAWLLHMLRALMFDLETMSDRTFHRFLFDLSILTNSKTFSNSDVRTLAEKYYGDSLDWFFDHWLYSRNLPEFNVEYSFERRDGQYFLVGSVETKKVRPSFRQPVLLRVEYEDGTNSFHRPMISVADGSLEVGPLSGKPKELHFNEFESVLCTESVKKK